MTAREKDGVSIVYQAYGSEVFRCLMVLLAG